jgi:hypothetical protein
MFWSHPPKAADYSSPAPSAGSSGVSILESRFMLVAWISAIRCFNVVPSISSSTSRYRKMPSSVMSCPFWRVLANFERFLQA